MKKIFIALRDFNTGGVQQSLINLLQHFKEEIKKKEIQFDILALKKGGPLLSEAEKLANVYEANARFLPFGMENREAKREGLLKYLKRSLFAIIAKTFGNNFLVKRALRKERVWGEYDVAISYSVGISNKMMYAGWSEIILEKVERLFDSAIQEYCKKYSKYDDVTAEDEAYLSNIPSTVMDATGIFPVILREGKIKV